VVREGACPLLLTCARGDRRRVILHGSLTLDDYVPGRSDVDLLVIVEDPLNEGQLAALSEVVSKHWRRAPGPVDLRLVTRQVAASPTPAPPMEAYLRLAPTSGVRVEERRHPGERDLAVELSVCRAHGRSLLGAAPAELLGEVPDRWVVAAGDAQLTACRVWRLAKEGRHCSKAAAGPGRWGAIPPSGWSVTPSSTGFTTRTTRSTWRRLLSCWRSFEPG
jgi:Nucleotidyltransferase domain